MPPAPPVVLGRRICTSPLHQGPRWRHILDFPLDRRTDGTADGYPRTKSDCYACRREASRQWWDNLSPDERHLINEQKRLQAYLRARSADRAPEQLLVAHAEPFVVAMNEWLRTYGRRMQASPFAYIEQRDVKRLGMHQLEMRTGVGGKGCVTERTLRRILNRESRFIELSVADRIAYAIGVPLPLLAEDFKTVPKMLDELAEQRAHDPREQVPA